MSGVIKQFPIEKEYEKNPGMTPEDIGKFRKWLMSQPHLPGEHLSESLEYQDIDETAISLNLNGAIDLDLAITYFSSDNSSEVSKQVLDLHYTLRTLFTTFFKDRKVDKVIEKTLHTILLTILPTPTAHGYKAIYARLVDPDANNFNFPNGIRALMMVVDLMQQAEGTWPGCVIMIDMDLSTLSHIAKLDLMSIRQVLYFLQECMLVRLKGVHFLNAPYFMDKVMMLLKPFMKKSLLDIIHIHQPNSETLYEYVPKKIFPKEEGGEYKDHATIIEETIQCLKANEEFFKTEGLRRVNEALRPGGKTEVEDIFSVQGSFKKLDID